ncbi:MULTISPECIES: GAF domain-containing protein [Bradyrhizobium]|uniref:GAF domain-containing protein n=1 Tax=Bradyrhizobium TaxID=374 RepID=UPI00230563E7|nr:MULTISPECIES: GAF domain-containing protein [unclassified Bradyrhizobium]MDA9448509.1 chemotaxis protein CheY [Bradyrhizobium sp. CCBAU 21360]MDA9455103.1 chemotaxis protein CheY [Bradyrhizobium sp. CCBAU 21359]MDA9515643.1 chemotaxis protein CheY [Bradyrhizobium sp. CCBAU 11430]
MTSTAGENSTDRNAVLAALGDYIREIANPDDLAYAAVELLGRSLKVSRAGYGTVDTSAETITIARDWNAPGILSLAGVLHFRDYGNYIEDLKRGETVICADAEKDPRVGDRARALEAISARALVNMPISEPDGVVALLYLNNATPRVWSSEELELIHDVAERTRTAVERRRAEAAVRENEIRLLFLDALNKETARTRDADGVMAVTTRMVGEHLGVSNCAYADMDPDQDGFTIRGDWAAPGAMHILGHYSLADFGEKAVRELSAGRPLVINDNLKEIAPEEAATFQNIGIGSTICMPLVKEGQLTALMAIHHRGPHRWTARELALLTEVTERSWAHIERVRSEQAAREAAERLSLANRAAGIGIWDYNPVNDVLRWDNRCKEVFGLSPDAEVSYEGAFLKGLHPDDRQRAHEAVSAALTPDCPKSYNIEFRTIGIEDGVERWIAATGQAIFSNRQAVRFIGTVLDISAQKKTERQLRILNDTGASVARERDLEKIVQIVTDAGVELTGAQFGAFFYNVLAPDGGSYMLYSLSGAPRSAFEKFPMPRNTAVFEPTFKGTGVVRSDDILQDPRYGRNAPRKGMPEGHLPVRSYLAVPVISRTSEVLGGLFFGHAETGKFQAEHEAALLGIAGHAATAIDNARLLTRLEALNAELEQRVADEIAERMKAEEQLRQSQKMEAVGQLTGGIAHDFNNMLAVILGSLNLAKRRLGKGEVNIDRFIEGAIDGANRAATLTQRLLAFSRQQPLAPEVVDINKMIGGMSELLERSLGELIRLEAVLAAGLWRVKADPAQLESAVINLAVNARDAMPKGGRLTIETSNASIDRKFAREYALSPGQYVLVAVTDNGTGIPPDVLGKVFDPFFTTKVVGKGTGLGLSQVYGFVRQSGGHVKVYSEVDVGTTVKIYLPRFAGDEGVSTPSQGVTHPGASLQSETILVVEDDERVRSISSESLRELGYTVIEAASAKEAIRMIENGLVPDLLFTDVVMPDMTGAELAGELSKRYPALKVLFTTGYTRNAIVHNGMLDAGKHLLSKPFAIEDLAAKVRALLDEI